MDEWVSAQLDHREKLEAWGSLWFYLCGDGPRVEVQ